MTTEALAAYKAAAARTQMTTSGWARAVLDAAAGNSDLPEQLARVVVLKRGKPVRDGKW